MFFGGLCITKVGAFDTIHREAHFSHRRIRLHRQAFYCASVSHAER